MKFLSKILNWLVKGKKPLNTQNSIEKELLDKLNKEIPISDLYGNYKIHNGVRIIDKLNKNDNFNLETIGFFISHSIPYSPAPTDIIPFATTGGDGCYFAFLTDFGNQISIEKCPIVFISPTDFDEKYPNQANKIFARNFEEFLSIMIRIKYAEIIRFKDTEHLDFNLEIKKIEKELEENDSIDYKELRNKTISKLKENFKLPEIRDLNQYYKNLNKIRKSNNYLILKDGINLRLDSKIKGELSTFDNRFSLEELKEWFKNSNLISRLWFYREASYIYSFSDVKYKKIQYIMKSYMMKDNYRREANIIRFEIEQNEISNKYYEIRNLNKIKTRGNKRL